MAKHKPAADISPSEGYWKRLTDDELQNISFTTDDPESLVDLVQEVPAIGERPFVELAYDFRGNRRPFIRCAHCKYPNHLAGFVIKTQDGERFLCGHNCGAKIYGADFARLHADFEHARDRASYLRRLTNMRLALPTFVSYLATLQRDPAFTVYSAVRQEFATDLPRLRGALQAALERGGGNLSIEEKVRDFAAEARDEDRYEREMEEWNAQTLTQRKKQKKSGGAPLLPEKPIFKSTFRVIATLQPMTLFSVQTSPLRIINEIATQFVNLDDAPTRRMSEAQKLDLFAYRGRRDARGGLTRVAVSIGDDTSNHSIATMLKQISILLERIEEQIDRLGELTTLFQPARLSAIADWANAHDLGGSYKAGPGFLSIEDGWGRVKTVTLPRDYRPPLKTGVEMFRAAIARP